MESHISLNVSILSNNFMESNQFSFFLFSRRTTESYFYENDIASMNPKSLYKVSFNDWIFLTTLFLEKVLDIS